MYVLKVEAGAGLFPDHSQSRPADILLQNWNLGRPIALDISVVSPLNPSTLAEAGAMVGAVLEATESRKHQANYEKCSALVPLQQVAVCFLAEISGSADMIRDIGNA